MAKMAKSHLGSAKTKKSKAVVNKAAKKLALVPPLKTAAKTKGPVSDKPAPLAKAATVAPVAPLEAKGKPVAERKPGQGGVFPTRPMMRRGRRPKALAEYQPANHDEEEYNQDTDYRGLEYDTGIQVNKAKKDDSPFNMDRFEEFDEELNFDF